MISSRTFEILKQLIELTEGTVYWKDREGRYQGGNTQQLKTTSFSSFDDMIGKTDFELYPSAIAKPISDIDKRIMETATPLTLEEIGVDMDGNEAIYLTKKKPLIDENGEVYGLIGASINITEKKISEQLKTMKMSFIQNMQHDIRTPFTGLWGLAQYLWEIEEDVQKKKYLDYIRQASKELFDYCNKIIEFAQIQANYWPLADQEFDLSSMIKNVFMIEQPAALYKNLELTYKVDSAIPSLVMSDEHRWFCIALNLLSNAIKFTERGKVEISLQRVNHDTEKQQALLQLIITDTGIGIPADKQNLIYLPFSRLHPSNQNKYSGLGFGLSLVKQFIEELAGTLEIDSIVGQGTSFKCIIPVKLPLISGEVACQVQC